MYNSIYLLYLEEIYIVYLYRCGYLVYKDAIYLAAIDVEDHKDNASGRRDGEVQPPHPRNQRI